MFSHIRKVDIELHNKCNRNCIWCSNHTYKREGYEEFPEDLYIKLLKTLRDNGFGNWHNPKTSCVFTFTRYSEPLLKPELVKERARIAMEILPPSVRIELNTNSDFLTQEIMQDLVIDGINIMDYDCKGYDYWVKFLEESGVTITRYNKRDEVIEGISSSIKKVVCRLNWPKNFKYENRGGTVPLDLKYNGIEMKKIRDGETRGLPCVEPSYMISIEVDGTVMPCYNMRSDVPFHQEWILGNIKEQSLEEIYKSEKALKIREMLSSPDPNDYPEFCRNCNRLRVGNFPGVYYCKSWENEEQWKSRHIYTKK